MHIWKHLRLAKKKTTTTSKIANIHFACNNMDFIILSLSLFLFGYNRNIFFFSYYFLLLLVETSITTIKGGSLIFLIVESFNIFFLPSRLCVVGLNDIHIYKRLQSKYRLTNNNKKRQIVRYVLQLAWENCCSLKVDDCKHTNGIEFSYIWCA